MAKDAVLELLWRSRGCFLSGEELARRLSVSPAAVREEVERLRAVGYLIDAGPQDGFCLSPEEDRLSEAEIRKTLQSPGLVLQVFPSISSTNTVLKALAADGAPEGTVIVAGEQTQGRGRMGRRFYSPAGTGLYMSILLRPKIEPAEATKLTVCAAAAVAEAIEDLAGVSAGIKWVNDVLVRGKKVCGILTEASLGGENGPVNYVVTGIGINVRPPAGDFPEELREIAGAVFEEKGPPAARCRLAAAVLDRFLGYYRHLGAGDFYESYRKRSVVLGKDIWLLSPGKDPVPAKALDIDRDFALLVRLADGGLRRVQTGEVRIRPAKAGPGGPAWG